MAGVAPRGSGGEVVADLDLHPGLRCDIKEAIVGCLEVRAEQGLPLTVRTVEVDVAVA